MPQVRVQQAGRVVRVDLDAGEELAATVGRVVEELGLAACHVSFEGSLASGRLILGQRKYTRATEDPDRVSFHDERQVLGSGMCEPTEDGAAAVRLQAVIGLERETFVARVVEAHVGSAVHAVLTETPPATSRATTMQPRADAASHEAADGVGSADPREDRA